MGTNTLNSRSGGQIIQSADVNQYRTALNEDVVPRNASGVATSDGGSLGTSALLWLKGWFTSIAIGTPANNNTIDEDGTDMRVNSDSGVTFDINSINSFDILEAGRLWNYVVSSTSSGNFNTNSATYVDVTNMTISITTKGNPVVVMGISDGSANISRLLATKVTAASISSDYTCLRGATDLGGNRLSGADVKSVGAPVGSLVWFDEPAAGTYTYKIQMKINSADLGYVQYAKLLVIEL